MLAPYANRTTFVTTNMRIDLLDPRPSDINFDVVAEHLAKLNRYVGGTPNLVYSVAEHSCRGAEAALRSTGDRLLAGYMLTHDMHEFVLNDDPSPKKRALEVIMGQFGVLAPRVKEAFDALTYRLDVAIHEAAGLPWPPSAEMQASIHHWDTVMLATEWRDLMCCEPPYDFGVEPLKEHISPAGAWITPCRRMQTMMREMLPAATPSGGRA